jgi:hypothetical protein
VVTPIALLIWASWKSKGEAASVSFRRGTFELECFRTNTTAMRADAFARPDAADAALVASRTGELSQSDPVGRLADTLEKFSFSQSPAAQDRSIVMGL